MATYDPKIIQEFAEGLYSRATTIVVVSVLFFALVGGIAGYFLIRGSGTVVLLAIGAAVGYYLGSQRAFLLKLQAQTALCQVEIERNTRKMSSSRNAPTQLASALDNGTHSREPVLVDEGELGNCPNCTRSIPLSSTECPRCKAVFTEGSAWKVQPLHASPSRL